MMIELIAVAIVVLVVGWIIFQSRPTENNALFRVLKISSSRYIIEQRVGWNYWVPVHECISPRDVTWWIERSVETQAERGELIGIWDKDGKELP